MLLPEADERDIELYKKVIKKYKKNAQMIVAMEECSELIKELAKCFRPSEKGNRRMLIADEITDVQIMLEQLVIIFSLKNAVRRRRTRKLTRLRKSIDKDLKAWIDKPDLEDDENVD